MKVTIKNPTLEKLLEEKRYGTLMKFGVVFRDNDGSVQHLDGLTEHEKMVFRTFSELDQKIIIDQV